MGTFLDELKRLLNRWGKDNESNTPDFILASYIENCLKQYVKTMKFRDKFKKKGEIMDTIKIPPEKTPTKAQMKKMLKEAQSGTWDYNNPADAIKETIIKTWSSIRKKEEKKVLKKRIKECLDYASEECFALCYGDHIRKRFWDKYKEVMK